MNSSPTVIQHKTSSKAILDFHVLWWKETEEELDRLLTSLKDLERVNIDIVKGGFPDHIGNARIYGFGLRCSKYCSFVDPDDYITKPEDVYTMIDYLETHSELCGVYGDYEAIDKKGKVLFKTNKKQWTPQQHLSNPFDVLHLKIYRRKAVMKHLSLLSQTPTYEEILINGLCCDYGPWYKMDLCSYRKTDDGQSMRLATDELLKRVIKLSTPYVMRHTKPKGLGDKITALTSKMGIKPCSGCLGRSEKLNQWFPARS